MIGRLLKNDFTVLVLRLAPLYVCIFLLQVIFYIYNHTLIGALSFSEIPMLLWGAFKFSTVSIFYLNAVFIALSLLPFRFRAESWYQKVLLWLYGVTNSVGIVALNMADVIYYRFAFKRITMEEMHFFQENDNTSNILFKSMGENWYLVLLAIALMVLLVWTYKKIKYHPTVIENKVGYYGVNTLVLVVSVLFWVLGIKGSFDFKARPIAMSNVAYYAQSPQKGVVALSNPYCLIRMAGVRQLETPHYFDSEAELESLFSPYHYPKVAGDAPAAGKNVVVFVLESFSREHSQYLTPHLNPTGGFTPFLDSLMQEGLVFTNCYSNGMKSIEALPSVLSSIPSYKTPFALLPQALNEMDGLPAVLVEQGYNANFFCGARANQMGFEAYGKLCGIQHFYNRDDFEKVNGGKDMANVWGVWDMPFLQYMADELNRLKTPFFSSVFTLTSHHPYNLPAQYAGRMPTGTTPVQPCVAYTDLSIRKFFEKASKMPWYRNTLFIFVADHVSPQMAAAETRTAKGGTAIICFMYTPDHSVRGRYEKVFQQLDIMPTVLGLMGYDKPYFAFGRDVFNEPDRYPMVTNCVNQIYQCLTDSMSLYFDGAERLYVYAAQDTMQRHNILNLRDSRQSDVERHLKALLQSYYSHVGSGRFKVEK